MTPLVTIGIPFRDPGKHFRLAVQSIFAQSFQDWELLLVNDGSLDGSLEFALQIADERVRVLDDGRQLGLPVRLNQIARTARGRYCFRMDADDVMHPLRLEKQLRRLLDKGGETTVVGSSAWLITEKNEVLGLFRPIPGLPGFGVKHAFIHSTVAAPTSWFLSNPYCEEPAFRRAQDVELWCRTRDRSEFDHIEEPLIFYRESAGPSMLRRYAGSSYALLCILKKYFSKPFLKYLVNCLAVCGKTVLFALAWLLGKEQWVARRYLERVQPGELSEAGKILEDLKTQVLPLKGVQCAGDKG